MSHKIKFTNYILEYTSSLQWRHVLGALAKALKDIELRPFIFFDEVQWLANYRSDFVSDLKMIWDQYLSEVTQGLILCGSHASFMVKKVIKSKALYGRTNLIINLRPFKIREVNAFLPNMAARETLEAYLLLGGIPSYLKLLNPQYSLYQNVGRHAFGQHSYFTHEYERIFVSHFGSLENYDDIVQVLAAKPYGLFRGQCAELLKLRSGGSFSEQLFNLEHAGFIRSYVPFDKSSSSKMRKYILSDNFLSFYFAFIKPNLVKVNSGAPNLFSQISSSPAYVSWLGRAFELAIQQHLHEIANILGFADVEYEAGPYFESSKTTSGVQIDLVFSRKDNVITICEAKYGRIRNLASVVKDFETKLDLIEPLIKRRSVQKVLIVAEPVSDEIAKSSYFHKILLFDESVSVS